MKEYATDSSAANTSPLIDFINSELEAAECSMKAQTQIDIAIDEIFSNISKFAYESEPGPVTVTIETDSATRLATVRFIDKGKPYNPLLAQDPDITLSAEDRQIGGLGIYLVKKTMNDVRYEYNDSQNILTITKNIG